MLLDKSIKQLAHGLRQGDFSSVDLINQSFSRIDQLKGQLNQFITKVDQKTALKLAQEKDQQRSKTSHPLLGIPFVLKDAYVTQAIRTTCGSKVLNNYLPQYSATVYQKLLDVGAILVGKMNQDAWGHGGSSENTDYGPVKNPWDTARVAGGSSGGPAVAIATRVASFAIGEDTGGSIRNPAAWTNTSGLKVTYGRVSRYGTIAYASSFDSVGPMAKTAEDLAIVLSAIAGQDKYDATTSPEPVKAYSESLTQNLKNITLGFPKELFEKGLDKEIKQAIFQAIEEYKELGVKVIKISMPFLEYGLPVYYLIGPSETSSNLARYDSVRYGQSRQLFTEETKRRIMIGSYALSSGYYDAYYRQAQKVRTLLIKEYDKAFKKCDAIIMPITPTPPTKIGELINNPLQNLLADIFTTTQNPVGVPSLAIPCGFTKSNLPIGMQLVGKKFTEDLLLNLGHQYQQQTSWHLKKPPL